LLTVTTPSATNQPDRRIPLGLKPDCAGDQACVVQHSWLLRSAHFRKQTFGAGDENSQRMIMRMGRICSVSDCERTHYGKSFCVNHYQRMKRNGSPTGPPKSRRTRPDHCTIEGCWKPVNSRGWCSMHYERWRKYDDPFYVQPKFVPSGSAGSEHRSSWPKTEWDCVEWIGNLSSDGYGRFFAGENPNSTVSRRVYVAIFGDEPEVVRHTCDNPSCYRIEHLLPGTREDNRADQERRVGKRYRA